MSGPQDSNRSSGEVPTRSTGGTRRPVTELEQLDESQLTTLDEAVALIDERLGGLTERNLVSASEVTDLLLDVRMLLSEKAKQLQ